MPFTEPSLDERQVEGEAGGPARELGALVVQVRPERAAALGLGLAVGPALGVAPAARVGATGEAD